MGFVCELRTSSLASHPDAWRMPQNRGLAAICASRAAPASGSVRSTKPTMEAHMRPSPYWPLALIAATPLTNSVSPTGRRASGPSARYIAMHSMNTVETTLWPLPVSASSASRR